MSGGEGKTTEKEKTGYMIVCAYSSATGYISLDIEKAIAWNRMSVADKQFLSYTQLDDWNQS